MPTKSLGRSVAPSTKKSSRSERPQEFYTFAWTGKNASGEIINGEVYASSRATAIAQIRQRQIHFISIRQVRSKNRSAVKRKDITVFTRQLATMLKAGVPILQALDMIASSSDKQNLKILVNKIRQNLESGESLSSALSKHKTLFSSLFCSMVSAGEQGGILDSQLERVATYQERSAALRSQLRSTMMYPTLILSVSAIVFIIIMAFVIPSFQQTFASMGASLPLPTLIIISISDWVRSNGLVLLGITVATIYACVRAVKSNRRVRTRVDRWIFRIPIFGPLIQKIIITRWCQTLSVLLSSGIPLVDALDSVANVVGNLAYYNATRSIQIQVRNGASLSVALKSTELFPPLVFQLISIGEESGQLNEMLGKSASFFETEVDTVLSRMSSLLEPLVISILGVIISTIIVAMYLPIFNIASVAR